MAADASATIPDGLPAVVPDPAPGRSSLHLLGRHQLASLAATAVDYTVMVVWVSVLGAGPVAGTAIGAATGALGNFALGRFFTFKATHHEVHHQAFRYLAVSVMSLLWNVLGEHIFAVVLGLQYVVARVIASALVGLCWNFPMHRHFVFRNQP